MSEKLTLFMESTKKEPEQTISEIQQILKNVGVRDLLINYDDKGEILAVSFTIQKENNRLPFKLPINHLPLWKLSQAGKTKYIKTEQQARRVAWRQIYRWIQSQIALIQTQMVTIDEIFLPYLMIDQETTVYDVYLEKGFGGYLTSGDK